MPTLSILTKAEQEVFIDEPTFTLQEKRYFFIIPEPLSTNLNSSKNKLLMTLLWGYFKATNKFYLDFKQKSNVDFVAHLYAYKYGNIDFSSTTLYRYRELIKKYLKINEFTDNIKLLLLKEAINLANNFIHRKKIFYTLVNLSKKLNIEVPSYTELTRIIQVALNTQKKDILERLESLQEDERLKLLDEFLEKNSESKNRYKIAYFRKLEHSTAKNQMLLSLGKLNTVKSKFNILQEIIDFIRITPKIAEYYAKWVEKGKTFQLNQINTLNQKFTLLSFVYYQYLIRNDNLIDRFISTVQTAKNSSFRAQKDFSFELEPKKNQVLQSLEKANLSTLNEIESIVKNEELSAVKKN